MAAPRGLSQPSTSFIASTCQGIHRLPLIQSLESKALPCSMHLCIQQFSYECFRLEERIVSNSFLLQCNCSQILLTVFAALRQTLNNDKLNITQVKPDRNLCSQRLLSNLLWWRMPGSNRRPLACKASALPAELIPQIKSKIPMILDNQT